MLKLQIKLLSINLSNSVVDHGDTIRVSITTVPDKQKEAKTFDAKDMETASPTFLIKMNDCIQKIIIVFRKKSFFSEGPIIASTIIRKKDIAIFNDSTDEDFKKIMIYEPAQNQTNLKDRRVIGSMEASFSLKEKIQHVHYVVKNNEGKEIQSLRAYFNENACPNF